TGCQQGKAGQSHQARQAVHIGSPLIHAHYANSPAASEQCASPISDRSPITSVASKTNAFDNSSRYNPIQVQRCGVPMRFKSIQFSVAFLAGASILAVAVALVIYALFAGARTQTLVQQRTQDLLQEALHERLRATADAQVGKLQRRFDQPMLLAGFLATLNSRMGRSTIDGTVLSTSREELSALLGEYLQENPDLVDLYIGWEANAFDEDDDLYAGQTESGYDASGRFMPWWYRDGDQLKHEPLTVELMQDQKRQATGVRMGEFYLCSQETGKPCVIDPASYDFGGKQIQVASFNAPVMVDGQFKGSVGNDLALDFIQEILDQAKQELYSGAG